MDNILTNITHHCDIHLQRNLSIRGRTTVLNTLILSNLWHVLRIVGASQKGFHYKLKSTISHFLCHRIFPRIAYQKLCQPRKQGGIGLIDPVRQ